jgi:hypothetical protein
MPRAFALALALFARVALATVAGEGRLTVEPSFWIVSNDTFFASAVREGHPVVSSWPGGPGGFLTGAYAIIPELEIEISVFGGGQRLMLDQLSPLTLVSYGAIAGVRGGLSFWEDRLRPTVMVGTGAVLVFTSGADQPKSSEKLNNGWIVGLGLSIALAPYWDLTLDYRFMFASRGPVTGIGSINGGGSWFSIGFSLLFDPQTSNQSLRPTVPELDGGMGAPRLGVGMPN